MEEIKMDFTINDVRRHIYELYQLDWLMSSGYALMDVVRGCAKEAVIAALNKCHDTPNAIEIYDIDPLRCVEDGICSWLDDGFCGACWVCYDEFLGAEYRDVSYIGELVKREPWSTDEIMSMYLADVEDGVPDICED
jgi:hypothetical protein